MLGNAVPSLVAEVLAREIRRQLLGDKRNLGPLKLIPPVRQPTPSPEPLARVPEIYESMVGDHADHPGERRTISKSAPSKSEHTKNSTMLMPGFE